MERKLFAAEGESIDRLFAVDAEEKTLAPIMRGKCGKEIFRYFRHVKFLAAERSTARDYFAEPAVLFKKQIRKIRSETVLHIQIFFSDKSEMSIVYMRIKCLKYYFFKSVGRYSDCGNFCDNIRLQLLKINLITVIIISCIRIF